MKILKMMSIQLPGKDERMRRRKKKEERRKARLSLARHFVA
jgi:hypothetical protein